MTILNRMRVVCLSAVAAGFGCDGPGGGAADAPDVELPNGELHIEAKAEDASKGEPTAPLGLMAAQGNPTIVNGSDATENYPFMASVAVTISGTDYHICGGALIKPGWVVTAAHCAVYAGGLPYAVRLGTSDLSQIAERIDVVEIIQHPDYPGDNGWSNDIALLRLSTHSTQAQIPIAKNVGGVGKPTRILGWGATCADGGCLPTKLQELNTFIAKSKQDCLGQADKHTEICTRAAAGSRACYGDSGGPQIKMGHSGWELIGVASRVFVDDQKQCKDAPSVYTDVTAFKSWISSHTG